MSFANTLAVDEQPEVRHVLGELSYTISSRRFSVAHLRPFSDDDASDVFKHGRCAILDAGFNSELVSFVGLLLALLHLRVDDMRRNVLWRPSFRLVLRQHSFAVSDILVLCTEKMTMVFQL